MTIANFIDALKASYGASWRETAIDVLLCGESALELRGVAVTMMATQESVAQAKSLGCNLVITHEPVFYNHQGQTAFLEGDAVYKAKREYLEAQGMAVFHLHDNLHSPKTDPISRGVARALGWEDKRLDDSYCRFSLPGVKLGRITRLINAKLRPAAPRYIGDPRMAYENVFTSWGFSMLENLLGLLAERESCVLVTGETHEWELVEYMRDAQALGFRKALVVVGHVCSEEAGVEAFYAELAVLFPELKVRFVRTGDLFLRG
jgi:putative NIF3 family GTP cyclohydrolase 1 type 2